MPVFRLKPIEENLDHPDWQASNFKKPCIVNAVNEKKAAQAAHKEFSIAVLQPPLGQKISISPWSNPELVDIYPVNVIGDIPPENVVIIGDKSRKPE